ncbi:MAG: archease [Candidatus Omnitrophota bacterium]
MRNYELLDHTADLGLRVFGADLKELFRNAAEVLFDIIAKKTNSKHPLVTTSVKIDLTAENIDELFVRWLSELVSLADCAHVIFVEFDIHAMGETHLEATVQGAPARQFTGKREIKAVTYCNLKIQKQEGRYIAEVIFDV